MRYLITGGHGFIGGHLIEKLSREGHEVFGLDNMSHPSKNPNVRTIYGDVRNRDLMASLIGQVDIVCHLAAEIHVDRSIIFPHEAVDVNINGTLNVLEACRHHKKKLVYASSSEVYGTSKTEYMSEEHPLEPQSPYAASKAGADRLCKSYIDTYGMDICILRNFNTFGPYQNDGADGSSYGAVIGIFTRNCLRGEPIRIFGDGEQQRDYMYITDALQAYNIAEGYTGVLNAGSGKTISINKLAENIHLLTNSKSEILHIEPRQGEVRRLCADTSKIKTLGFKPETDLNKHLAAYVEWHRRFYENMASGNV